MRVIYQTALALIIIGGLNWGLVGFFDYNLVDALFGTGSVLARIVYSLVGLSAIYVSIMKLMPEPAPKNAAM
ncbi:MAG: hypothetical protein JWP06_487 [Candidatus Saccharibacteria bacterium]|nr:hypothetical protein [Candidatus Saccharibacteria bacterium]